MIISTGNDIFNFKFKKKNFNLFQLYLLYQFTMSYLPLYRPVLLHTVILTTVLIAASGADGLHLCSRFDTHESDPRPIAQVPLDKPAESQNLRVLLQLLTRSQTESESIGRSKSGKTLL